MGRGCQMAKENNDSIEFRLVYPRRTKIDEKDNNCKTIVKIEPRHMQSLGIKQGDVVKVSGNTKSTAAVCLQADPGELEELAALSPDPVVEYLNNPKKKMQFPPRAIIYGPVSCNVDQTMDLQRTATISKFPGFQGSAENVCNAQTVTLATIDLAEKMMPQYQDNLDYDEVQDFIISKGDRINIPFQQKWLEEKQKEMQQRQESSQQNARRPNRPRRPESFFPRALQSAIFAASPEGKEFWRITEDTKFKFENADILEMFEPPGFRSKNLVNVIPISKQLSVEDTEFIIPSLEVYSGRMKLIWYSHQRVKVPESDFGDPQKMNKMRDMTRISDNLMPVIEIKDDLGNQYPAIMGGEGGGGGSSGPDPITREIISNFSWERFFAPALDSNAREVVITIKEIYWLKQKRNALDLVPPPTEPPFMTPIDHPAKLVIVEGPRIPVNPPPK